jgi:hypothetical protein
MGIIKLISVRTVPDNYNPTIIMASLLTTPLAPSSYLLKKLKLVSVGPDSTILDQWEPLLFIRNDQFSVKCMCNRILKNQYYYKNTITNKIICLGSSCSGIKRPTKAITSSVADRQPIFYPELKVANLDQLIIWFRKKIDTENDSGLNNILALLISIQDMIPIDDIITYLHLRQANIEAERVAVAQIKAYQIEVEQCKQDYIAWTDTEDYKKYFNEELDTIQAEESIDRMDIIFQDMWDRTFRGENVPIYLNVPFDENDRVKKLGARFDWDMRKWYISGTEAEISTFLMESWGEWI